ncbi:ATPase H+ transporting accessory protein 1 like b [Megalops cyprinoides]|uniref:ATPase H+ transporting accessory protein 1 like b n=1 Tax=Megalops cyprinoides TaxID=118141 RepID=UPI0018651BA7|nr:ATPase H+ transporting accessory protein 1 like b [Megalops cyprinoides]
MAKHKLSLLFPVLLLVSLPPSLPCNRVPGGLQPSSEIPAFRAVGIRGGVGAVRSHIASHDGSLASAPPNPLSRILQPSGWSQQAPPRTKRKLLQASGSAPYPPLSVASSGRLCILFRARKLAIRYRNHTSVDLTDRVFGPNASVDTKDSHCSKDTAVLSLGFGDVEHMKGLVIRLEMSSTFYESAGQTWFTLDSVHIHYNCEHQASFSAPEVYAPTTHSYHCQHISSLPKYDSLLLPSRGIADWHVTFTDFQLQAFNVQSERFASARDCAALLTPAVLMGLVSSLILLLVLAYALHMVVHLKHIDRYEEHKTTVYFPRSPDADRTDKNSL